MMINLFFNWLNFGILITISCYTYKRWFKERLHALIQLQKSAFQDLQDQANNLKNQTKEISFDLILEQNKANVLLEKLQCWEKSFKSEQAQQAQTFDNAQIIINQNNIIKLQNLSIGLAQKELLTDVLDQATSLLVDKFQKIEMANLMLKKTLDKLNQSSGI